MRRERRNTSVLVVALGLATLACAASAGPLDPPTGPIQSTYKTLTQVEPRTAINSANTPGDNDVSAGLYKITKPGSYYLEDNLTGVSGKHGIKVVANNVTIDLNGFQLIGVAGTKDGINASQVSGLRIINGHFAGWGFAAVRLTQVTGASLGDLTARGCVTGFFVAGSGAVDSCEAIGNSGVGFSGTGVRFTDCRSTENQSFGFSLDDGCVLRSCVSSRNTGAGFNCNFNLDLVDCVASGNGGDGVLALGGARVIGCVAEDNSGSGIVAAGTNGGGIIRDCSARFNGVHGFAASTGFTLLNNNAYQNAVTSAGAGIYVSGSDNRIEGNNCVGATYGVKVDGAGNFIIRNSCSSLGTDWVFVANNVYGPIRDRRTPASPAINGFDAPGSLGTAEPNVNFSY